MTTPEKVRESFENHIASLGWSPKMLEMKVLELGEKMVYTSIETQARWNIWQAAIESQSSIIEGLRKTAEEAIEVLMAVSITLSFESEAEDSAIIDTIWHTPTETLFDYIGSSIARLEATLPSPGESNNG